MNATYTAQAVSDLYQAGLRDDGHPFIAERFYVIAEDAAGRRICHEAAFYGAEEVYCEESGESYFADVRAEASAKAERLAAKVNAALAAGVALDRSRWFDVDPAYGSEAYHAEGIEAQRAFADRQG